jgi:PleD family two-component response regulator
MVEAAISKTRLRVGFRFECNLMGQRQQEEEEKLSPFTKRILIVDDDPDITFTFKKAFDEANRISANKISFHVNTYNDPLLALSEFKPDFYDLLLVDINMPKMNEYSRQAHY